VLGFFFWVAVVISITGSKNAKGIFSDQGQDHLEGEVVLGMLSVFGTP